MTDVPNYLVRNRRAWDIWAKSYEESGRRSWATSSPRDRFMVSSKAAAKTVMAGG